jgi:hypothetical protein
MARTGCFRVRRRKAPNRVAFIDNRHAEDGLPRPNRIGLLRPRGDTTDEAGTSSPP